MNSYFFNLFRFFTSEPIAPEVSQCEAAREVPSGVKKAASDIVNKDGNFQSDIRNLVDHFGALQDGKVIEVGL